MTDVAETAVAVTTIDDNILRLCGLSDAELVHAKGNSRLSWVSLSMAKEMSSRLNLNKSHNKGELIDNIIAKRKRVSELSDIHAADDEEDSDVESKDFKSNQNTFPRLCNIILNCPDAVVRSAVLASRYSLQNKETNEKQPVFTEARNLFNNRSYDSGGTVSDHPEFVKAKVDTEKVNPGRISCKKIFKLFNTVIKEHAFIANKYSASGQHNEHDFFLYCQGNVNALYLHLKLKQAGNSELNSYCAEGAEIQGGLDTSSTTVEPTIKKRNVRATSNEKTFRDFTEVYKKKSVSTELLNSAGADVQYSMMHRNNQQTSLLMLQKVELLQLQIDKAEDRPNFNRHQPSRLMPTKMLHICRLKC